MIRVLQCVNIMDRAGLETMLMNYYRHIDRTKIQFDFLTHRAEKGAYDSEILSLGGNIYQAPRLYPQNYPLYFRWMKDFFQNHPEYQIVHSHIDTMSAFPLAAAKKAGVPVRIGHSHSSKLDLDKKLPIKYFAKLAMPFEANVYAACSAKAGEFMYGSRRFRIINNAIDLHKFQFDKSIRDNIRRKYNLEGKIVIGHVGRFYYVKNQSFLIDIFRCLKQDIPEAALLLIGKGEDEQQLRSKVDSLQLTNDVHFLIDRSDVNDFYQAMDVFVMPSLFEGLPVVGIEAQANGLPCLFSDRISDEIILTDNAEKMNINLSPDEWAKKIITMRRSTNQDDLEKLREKGYDVSLEAKKLTEWYIELLKNAQENNTFA